MQLLDKQALRSLLPDEEPSASLTISPGHYLTDALDRVVRAGGRPGLSSDHRGGQRPAAATPMTMIFP